MTSGQTMEDIKELSLSLYPEGGRYPQFKYWDAFLVLKDSPKFQQGRAEGFPKRMRRGISGNYSSSGGSVDLTEDVDEVPPPASRRQRPIGQKTAMRMSRGSVSGSAEVQSSAAETLSLNIRMQGEKHLLDAIMEWSVATDSKVKKQLFIAIQSMKRTMGLPLDDDEDDGGANAGDAPGEDADE